MNHRRLSSMSILVTAMIAGVLLSACGQAAAAAATAAPTATSPTSTSMPPTAPVLSITVVATAPGAVSVAPATDTPAPAAAGLDGATLLAQRCSQCHSANRVVGLQGTADQWKQLVDVMINQGAQLTPDEEAVLVTYLAANFHP
jgi:mono/diheme cytochrome c family protein